MYKGINKFKKSYRPCANVKKKDDGTLVPDTISMLSRWGHLLNVNQSSSIQGSEIYTAEPHFRELSRLEAELAIGN